MKAIDSLLGIVVRQEASELRLASNRPPRLFRGSEELSLTMPATSAASLLALVGDLVEPHEGALRERGSAVFAYRSADAGDFEVSVSRKGAAEAPDYELRFARRSAAPSAPRRAAVAPSAAPRAAAADADAAASIGPVLQQAVKLAASDVHLTQGRPPIVRVDGELRVLHDADSPDITSLVPDPAQLERVLAGHAIDLGLDVAGVGRLRVNVYASEDGLSAAVRLLKREAPPISSLGLPPVVQSLVRLPHGLVIACGPTGSGKSTTLAALAQEALRLRPRVLITLEDPIEYRIGPGSEGGLVRQREIRRHAADFATGLRDALREDPDILLIGEMRDAETISLALTAAETGHLVLTSLHSRTSASAIERIVDIYPPERQRQVRVQLADSLRAVIAQRLLPRASGAGRVPAIEFLRVTHGVANLIREHKMAQIQSALQAGRDEGMVPLERSLADLVRDGTVTAEMARGVASDAKMFDDYLGVHR